MNKVLVLIILLASSTVSLASGRYTLATTGKGVIAWIVDQKTGIVPWMQKHIVDICKEAN